MKKNVSGFFLLLHIFVINFLFSQSIEPSLILTAGGNDQDIGNSVSVDNSGNIYLGGTFRGVCNFGNDSLISAGSTDGFLAKYDASGNTLWVRRMGGAEWDEINAIAVSDDAVYVTGSFSLIANFNTPSSAGSNEIVSGGASDVFIAKYDTDGNFIWAKRAGGTQDDLSTGISLSDDNIYIAGMFFGTANFNSPSDGSSNTITSAGLQDMFIAKYDKDGNIIWAKRAGGIGADKANGIAVQGNSLFLAGYFVSTANFNTPSQSGTNELVSAGNYDIFVAKFDTQGNFIWAKRAGGSGFDEALSIAIDETDVYITGFIEQSADFNTPTATGSNELVSQGNDDIFVAKYDTNGDFKWAKRAGSNFLDRALSISAYNNVIHITGYFNSTANFNSPFQTGSNEITSAGGRDIFVASYLENGDFRWAIRAGGDGLDNGRAITVSDSLIYVTGSYRNSANFNTPSTPGSNEITSTGSDDIFIVKYTVSATVSIGELNLNKLLIYPNPATNHLHIDFGKSYSNITLDVRNINGQLVERKNLQNIQQHELNVSQWNDGLYFVTVISDDEVVIRKIVKR